MFKEFYFHRYPKNFLIFFPLVLSNKIWASDLYLNLFYAFILFSFINYTIYSTNDYLDYNLDKINKLKKAKRISKKKVVFLNLLTVIILIKVFFFYDYIFSKYLIIYLVFFYIYTFKIKFYKYLDILCLQSFYLIRCFYGADIANINLSLGFIIFFFFQFFLLALLKRVTQIKVNNLSKNNKIISYSVHDSYRLYLLSYISFAIITIILFLYFFGSYWFFDNVMFFNSLHLKINTSIILISIYLGLNFRLIFLSYKNKIQKDLVDYAITDKINLFGIGIIILLIIWN